MLAVERLKTALADRYRIERELGAGGMATVYLAQDLRHDRKVALKVLRPELSAILGADRFLGEIKTTANLQHPHILSLFDSGEADGLVFYVMPFVEGESLRDRIRREHQLPVGEAVRIAREVADALDYAHRHQVIHRDIKPENILLHDGRALVADFGIALAVSRSDGGTRMTETGMSLGTPHYMSPEQAMGEREITARSDVYALGVVLYEMLTGEPPFTGPTAQAIIARVMTEEPRRLVLQRKTVPPHVEAVVRRALEKLPADRFETARAFAEAVVNVGFPGPADTASSNARVPIRAARNAWRGGAAATAVAVVLVSAWLLLGRQDAPAPVMRFRLALDTMQAFFFTGQANPPRVALSPNGREMVYVGAVAGSGAMSVGNLGSSILGSGSSGTIVSGGANVLMHRRFSELDARVLPGTEGAWAPQFAPDGERVAYMTIGTANPVIRVVSLTGGPPVTLLDTLVGSAVTWGPDDYLYFLHASAPNVYRVAASGGPPELVTKLHGAPGMTYGWPSVLPGGKGIIITARPRGNEPTPGTPLQNAGLEVQVFELKSGALRHSIAGAFGTYAPTGHLLYVTSDRTLMAARLDASSLALTGRPAALIEGIDVRNDGVTDVAIAPNGTLAYTTPSVNAPETVSWVMRDGSASRVDPSWTRDWEFEGVALSPDGRRAAVVIEGTGRGDVWIKQLDQGPLSRLTFSGTYNAAPTWSPDGRYVMFVSIRPDGVGLWRKAADGSDNDSLLFTLDRRIHFAESSRDGRWLIVSVGGATDDIYAQAIGRDSAPRPLIADSYDEFLPALSPNGRWLAYVSNESGRSEIYLRPFPAVHVSKRQLSTDGGTEPIWSASSKELYFRSLDRRTILSVDLARGPDAVTSRVAARLPAGDDFELNPRNRLYDVAPGGRFLMIQRAGATDVSGDLVVVLNWFQELTAKVGR